MVDYEFLLSKAKEISESAYAPYSKFKVGACVLTSSGTVYTGCNFENSSYGLTICAERNAIGTAISNGEREIEAIAVYSPNMGNCMPCGACRQVIYEFRSKNGTTVITENGGKIAAYSLEELLPEGFSL